MDKPKNTYKKCLLLKRPKETLQEKITSKKRNTPKIANPTKTKKETSEKVDLDHA